jgi:hypothetical protein
MKIPFEKTLVGGFKFTFSNFLSIMGIAWFPFLLLGLLAAGLVASFLPLFTTLLTTTSDKWDQTQIVPLVSSLLGSFALLFVAMIVVYAMIGVGMMRTALGQHPAPVYFFFSLGEQVWRMIGAFLLLMLLAWGLMIAFALGIALVSFALSKFAPAAQAPVTGLLTFVAILAGIYTFVRIQFFLPAVVVAEHHIGLRRSWNLGRGNFWRIVGIMILVSLPPYLVFTTILSSVLQISMSSHAAELAAVWPHMVQNKMSPEELRQYFMIIFGAIASVWPILVIMELLYMMALSGLSAGAIATAYKLVTGASEPDAPKAAV